MRKIFIQQSEPGKTLTLDNEQNHYLKNVLRLENNETLEIYDGKGRKYQGVFEQSKKQGLVQIGDQFFQDKETFPKIVLAFVPIKGDYLFHALRMATEMGVKQFIPVISERCVRKDFPRKRIHTIVEQACLQSEQLFLPKVEESTPLFEFLPLIETVSSQPLFRTIGVLKWNSLPQEYSFSLSSYRSIVVLIGPEGGFTDNEEQWAISHGFVPMNIGESIFRADTAIVAMLTFTLILKKYKLSSVEQPNQGDKHV